MFGKRLIFIFIFCFRYMYPVILMSVLSTDLAAWKMIGINIIERLGVAKIGTL